MNGHAFAFFRKSAIMIECGEWTNHEVGWSCGTCQHLWTRVNGHPV